MILSLDPDIYPSPTQKISHELFPVFSCFFQQSTQSYNFLFPFPASIPARILWTTISLLAPFPTNALFLSPSIFFPYPVPKRYNAKKDRNPHKRVPAS